MIRIMPGKKFLNIYGIYETMILLILWALFGPSTSMGW